jgi:hypothetical protein
MQTALHLLHLQGFKRSYEARHKLDAAAKQATLGAAAVAQPTVGCVAPAKHLPARRKRQ